MFVVLFFLWKSLALCCLFSPLNFKPMENTLRRLARSYGQSFISSMCSWGWFGLHYSYFNHINQWWKSLPQRAFLYRCMGGYSVHVHCRESTLHRQVSTKFLKKPQTADLKQGLNNVKYACELPFGLDVMVLTIMFKDKSWCKTTSPASFPTCRMWPGRHSMHRN